MSHPKVSSSVPLLPSYFLGQWYPDQYCCPFCGDRVACADCLSDDTEEFYHCGRCDCDTLGCDLDFHAVHVSAAGHLVLIAREPERHAV